MSTSYTIPQPGTSLSSLAYGMAPSWGVDAGFITSALILLNGNMAPDALINPGQVINLPTMAEITTLMNTGTIPVAPSTGAKVASSTVLIMGVGLIGVYLLLSGD